MGKQREVCPVDAHAKFSLATPNLRIIISPIPPLFTLSTIISHAVAIRLSAQPRIRAHPAERKS